MVVQVDHLLEVECNRIRLISVRGSSRAYIITYELVSVHLDWNIKNCSLVLSKF